MQRIEGQGTCSGIILAVRRFFVLFLLVLLPLQFAFAAAAPYCALEEVKIASHFGHHEHPDAPELEPSEDGDGQAKLHDCAICHLSSGQAHAATAQLPAVSPAAPVRALPDDRQPQHLQEPTDRPPRRALV